MNAAKYVLFITWQLFSQKQRLRKTQNPFENPTKKVKSAHRIHYQIIKTNKNKQTTCSLQPKMKLQIHTNANSSPCYVCHRRQRQRRLKGSYFECVRWMYNEQKTPVENYRPHFENVCAFCCWESETKKKKKKQTKNHKKTAIKCTIQLRTRLMRIWYLRLYTEQVAAASRLNKDSSGLVCFCHCLISEECLGHIAAKKKGQWHLTLQKQCIFFIIYAPSCQDAAHTQGNVKKDNNKSINKHI